ncbi:MAG TPA: glucose sorbosone dehydrogenase, partial [Sphingobacteriaceae bacterium]|nr:glucose sorbosone dehydrogenase [Sphingobacteriaceae bacterium]
LYIAVGDGGSGGDPQGNGQNRKQLLGKILRIDVNSQTGGMNYGIPNDNPYKGNTEGLREEIYAYGMRNPWRFSFDHATNTLWAGDVGQNLIEEVDIIEKGGNYG